MEMLALTGKAVEGDVLTAVEVIPNSETQRHVWSKYKKDIRYQWYGDILYTATPKRVAGSKVLLKEYEKPAKLKFWLINYEILYHKQMNNNLSFPIFKNKK